MLRGLPRDKGGQVVSELQNLQPNEFYDRRVTCTPWCSWYQGTTVPMLLRARTTYRLDEWPRLLYYYAPFLADYASSFMPVFSGLWYVPKRWTMLQLCPNMLHVTSQKKRFYDPLCSSPSRNMLKIGASTAGASPVGKWPQAHHRWLPLVPYLYVCLLSLCRDPRNKAAHLDCFGRVFVSPKTVDVNTRCLICQYQVYTHHSTPVITWNTRAVLTCLSRVVQVQQ